MMINNFLTKSSVRSSSALSSTLVNSSLYVCTCVLLEKKINEKVQKLSHPCNLLLLYRGKFVRKLFL